MKLYFRVFHYEKSESILDYCHVYQCSNCEAFEVENIAVDVSLLYNVDEKPDAHSIVPRKHSIETNCKVCSSQMIMSGPIWRGSLINYDIVKRLKASIL